MVKRLLLLFVLVAATGLGVYKLARSFEVEVPGARASRLLSAGDVFGAQVVLRGLIKAHPREIEPHLALIQTLLATDDWLSAEREAKTLRALGVERAVVAPMLVRAYAGQRRFRDILTEASASASRPDEQAMNLAFGGIAYLGLNDLVRAQAALNDAAALAPNAFLVRLGQARIAAARQDGPAVVREAEAAVALQPASTEALWALSEGFRLSSDQTRAIGALDTAVSLAPMSQELRMARARLLLDAGLDQRAKADVDAVRGIAGSNLTASYIDAVLIMRAGRMADAEVAFERLGASIDLFPKAHLYEARIRLQFGNRESALQSLERYLKLQPADPDGVLLAAQTTLDAGRPEQALALLRSVRDTNAAVIDLEGRALFTLGEMPEAVARFERAVQLAPNNRDMTSHLAAAQTASGSQRDPLPGR